MKVLLTTFVVISLAGTTAIAQVDPKINQQCLKAADYKGCFEVMSGKASNPPSSNEIDQLKNALRLLPGRLSSTSLRDFTSNTQIFRDAVSAITRDKLKNKYEEEFYSETVEIMSMTDSLQSYWSVRIHNGTSYGKYGSKEYYCPVLKNRLDAFNLVAGPRYAVAYNGYVEGGFFGRGEVCLPQESDIIAVINSRAQEALVEPEVRKAELARKQRGDELARLAPWERHLEENPKLKEWVKANPGQGIKAREKFLIEQSQKQSKQNTGFPSVFSPR